MLGNFCYSSPTKLWFGKQALDGLSQELAKYGPNVLFVYGKASIKKNGIYDDVMAILRQCGKSVTELSGVMPNPSLSKLKQGIELARQTQTDLILAVGGGSVCDYAKGVAAGVFCPEDPWQRFYLRQLPVENPVLPVGCVLTMSGTGSEMNAGSVITDEDNKFKSRASVWRRIDSEVCHPQSALHAHRAEVPNDSRRLRYHEPHTGAVL